MEDASSDFSDWEVLSAASEAGGGDDEDDVVLVSGQGGDVLYDHFALDPSSSLAAEGSSSSSEAAFEDDDGEVGSGLGSVDRLDLISPEPPVDLTAVADSNAQSQLREADVTAHGSLLGAGASSAQHEEQIEEALGPEVEATRSRVELDSIPARQGGVEGILDSDATAVDGVRVQAEDSVVQLEDSSVQLEDGGADSITETSAFQAAATGDEVSEHGAPEEEPEQGMDASAASGCGESDGDDKDCSSPLAAAVAPVTGEGAERQLIVWWRLPFKLIHYCAWKVRPVWSISIAAAFLGIVVLGRRIYRMRRKTRGLPQIKLALDDKRASQFADRAARLNEAFLIAKRVPALRTTSGTALPWPMMQER